jgi:hypothetical protein
MRINYMNPQNKEEYYEENNGHYQFDLGIIWTNNNIILYGVMNKITLYSAADEKLPNNGKSCEPQQVEFR